MEPLSLKPFARRVRYVRCWRGLAIGGTIGGVVATVWATLDWARVSFTTPVQLGTCIVIGAIVGALIGLVIPIRSADLANSVDRRAGLENRLTAAEEQVGGEFHDMVRADAVSHLAGIRPKNLYPFKVGRWHAGWLGTALVTAALFMLGNTPVLLTAEAKAKREEMVRKGNAVERVIKKAFEDPQLAEGKTDEERRLESELRKFQRELQRDRLTREEAIQKSNELQQKAADLMKQSQSQVELHLQSAEAAMQKMQASELQKAGLSMPDPHLAQMSTQQREAAKKANEQRMADLKKQLSDLKAKLDELNKQLAAKGLSAKERAALEEQRKQLQSQIKELEKQLKEAKEFQEALKLSEEAQKVFERMKNDPLFKMMEEMAAQMKSQMKDGKPPKLSKEDLEKMKQALEALARKLSNNAEMQKYLKAMLEAMKKAQQGGRMMALLPGAGGLSGDPFSIFAPEVGAPTADKWNGDSGKVKKYDVAHASQGTTHTNVISGDRQEKGDETFIEIKGPTQVGNRSSVPYMKVLPSYRQKAESALERQQIPKEHQQRVKEYFKSLGQ